MLRILMGLAALGLLAIPAQAADYYYGGESYAGVPYRHAFPPPAGLRRSRACWPR